MDGFVKTVKEMREAQRSYFKTRNQENLERSKRLEQRVDIFLREIESGQMVLNMPEKKDNFTEYVAGPNGERIKVTK
jgi:hypothetical protein